MKPWLAFFLLLLTRPAAPQEWFPVSVWYGGGKARAPMLEPEARSRKEQWRKDVRAMKALGFNTVRAWLDWATGEPSPGRYNFEHLDVLLELAEEEGLRLFLQVYMDSAPAWVGRRYPDSLFVSANGMAIRPEASPGYCVDHPEVRRVTLAFYRALAEHVRNRRAFVGWDLWSEPHVINWANPTYIPNPEFCFCPHTIRRFRSWLQKKYRTLEALNRAWYRRYESWDEVEPGRLSTILSYTDYIDWKAFIVDKLGEDLADRYRAVKEAAPRTIVTSHAAIVGLFTSPHHWEGQPDDWRMAAEVDFYGTSFYPKHSAFVDRSPPWRGALLDFARSFGYSAGKAQGFYVGELQGGFGTIALNVSPTVTPSDLRIWMWSALARGAKGVHVYAWYPMSSGYESGGFGLIELDGRITERARAAGAVARTVDRHQKLFLAARPAPAEVAVLYNPLAHFVGGRQRAAAYGGPQGEAAGIERDSLLGIYAALWERNVPVDYVHVQHMTAESLSAYRLLYVPYPLMLPERAARVLREYVDRGGKLVAEARLGWNNERGFAAERIPGMGLDELMGCREAAIETAPGGRTRMRWTAENWKNLPAGTLIPGRWYEETLEPAAPAAQVVARFENGSPAAVLSRFGRGETLMLGSYVSAARQSAPSREADLFFAALLDWAGVDPPAVVSGSPLELRLLPSGEELLLFAFNHAREQAVSSVSLPSRGRQWQVTDLERGDHVQLGQQGQRLNMDLRVPPHDVIVIRLSPR